MNEASLKTGGEDAQESTIQSIIKGSRTFEGHRLDLSPGSETNTLLDYGQKSLTVSYANIPGKMGIGATYLKNTGEPSEAIQNETTLLYKAAKEIFQEIANRTHKSLCYKLRTTDPAMIEWAETAGTSVFAWAEEYIENHADQKHWIFETIIEPEKT